MNAPRKRVYYGKIIEARITYGYGPKDLKQIPLFETDVFSQTEVESY
jgi:hypothetical protein